MYFDGVESVYLLCFGSPKVTRCSALMEASKAGAGKLVRAILQKGGNPDLLDQEGRCAAHFAAEGGFLEVMPWHSE